MDEQGNLSHNGHLVLTNSGTHNMRQTNRLRDKVVLVIGGDNENGRSLIIALAQKGADIVLVCIGSLQPATLELEEQVEELGQRCLIIIGDPSSKRFAQWVMRQVIMTFGRLDVFIDYSAQNEDLLTDDHPVFPNFALMAAALGQMSES